MRVIALDHPISMIKKINVCETTNQRWYTWILQIIFNIKAFHIWVDKPQNVSYVSFYFGQITSSKVSEQKTKRAESI